MSRLELNRSACSQLSQEMCVWIRPLQAHRWNRIECNAAGSSERKLFCLKLMCP